MAATPRLARTFSRARWDEYRSLLELALERGYRVVGLEAWVLGAPPEEGARTLVVRHDVDQHPRSALRMAAVEQDLGVSSTWYFRWRTARSTVIESLRETGAAVGLHYETLTRFALAAGIREPIESGPVIDECRARLREEIESFARLFGPIRSAAAHGDSRVPGVRNTLLLEGEDPASYGIEFDGSLALRERRVAAWLTDRAAPGDWAEGEAPAEKIAAGVSPLLCLTHPNNWVSGPGLWADRAVAALLPAPARAARGAPLRTGSDLPPA